MDTTNLLQSENFRDPTGLSGWTKRYPNTYVALNAFVINQHINHSEIAESRHKVELEENRPNNAKRALLLLWLERTKDYDISSALQRKSMLEPTHNLDFLLGRLYHKVDNSIWVPLKDEKEKNYPSIQFVYSGAQGIHPSLIHKANISELSVVYEVSSENVLGRDIKNDPYIHSDVLKRRNLTLGIVKLGGILLDKNPLSKSPFGLRLNLDEVHDSLGTLAEIGVQDEITQNRVIQSFR
jgi:hypothetical protein